MEVAEMKTVKTVAAAFATLLFACTGPMLPASSDGPGGVGADGRPSVGDISATEAVDIPSSGELTEPFDTEFFVPDQTSSWDTSTGGCDLGEGCFLDKCSENSDCLSGWCVDHMGEKVCTVDCQDECPPGWSCQQVAGSLPDLVFVCVSAFSNLCRPCAAGLDCKGAVGAEDVCVDYGVEGSFCGGTCKIADSNAECPWGFTCRETNTVDDIPTTQCVADAGVCPCTDRSVELALWTPCEVDNQWGTCTGKRVCTTEGLAACDATVPAAESCNGLDDDCNGLTDEDTCDDGNPCTTDSCNGEEGCQYVALTEGECMDGDTCTIGDHCEEGVCVGTPIDCDDDNPCTDDSCDGLGGCKFENNSATCDDADPCTVADQCQAGTCEGVAVSCDCQASEDCAALEDGDLCNGTLFCDIEKLPYQCAVAPDTVVFCPEPEGEDLFCLAAVCDPDNGKCSIEPAHEGFACNDGNQCTSGESCQEGVCQGGAPVNCKDDNPCTDDSCAPDSGCVHQPNQEPCSDGDACTEGDQCAGNECLPGTPMDCNDLNVCNGPESCHPGKGCQPGAALVCDDGAFCNGIETCHPQDGCIDGPAPDCDDGNPCTGDLCVDGDGCVHTPAEAECDDGNMCTQGDHCSAGECAFDTLADCQDDDPCTDDSCNPAVGCVHNLNESPCNDDDLCTTGDHCHLGECIGAGTLACNDQNPCTDDSCGSQSGCQFAPNDESCDDGNECTTDDHCAGAVCAAGGSLDCDDHNPCTNDSCDPGTGCVHTPNTAPCNDEDPCTTIDVCSAGECTGGELLDCDDGNDCTTDSCASEAGCLHAPLDTGNCDDNDPCTVTDTCSLGNCEGSGAFDCDDLDVCTEDSCVPFLGCDNAPLTGTPCDDSNECTTTDLCSNGQCFGSGAPDCDDGNACTTDVCVPPGGCLSTPLVPCCGDGVIDAPEECDDGNAQSGDGCDADCMEETAVTMSWVDPQTGSCNGQISQAMQPIAAAMPAGAINVTIKAKQLQPLPNFGEWTGTFENTTCVRQWLVCIAEKNGSAYDNWDPGVCHAVDTNGDDYFFICKPTGSGTQIAIYPVGVATADYMKLYMLDRTGPWCDLAGVNNRPGFDTQVTNSNTSGVAGDYVEFTWWW